MNSISKPLMTSSLIYFNCLLSIKLLRASCILVRHMNEWSIKIVKYVLPIYIFQQMHLINEVECALIFTFRFNQSINLMENSPLLFPFRFNQSINQSDGIFSAPFSLQIQSINQPVKQFKYSSSNFFQI